MKPRQHIYVLFLIFSMPIFGFSQNIIGLSNHQNFTKKEYNAGLQNWDVKIDGNGVCYFANNEGLLTFDNKNWKIFALPNQTIVRSICIAKNKKIYVGGQDELGYFNTNQNGTLVYKSLKSIIPKQFQKFADVWGILEYDGKVFFRTMHYIFILENEKMEVLPATSEWIFMQATGGSLLAQDRNAGIFRLEKRFWEKLPQTIPFKSQITGFHKLSAEKHFITTLSDGLWFLAENKLIQNNGSISFQLKNARIYKSYQFGNNYFALATSSEGIFMVDSTGNMLQNISEKEGLLDNNVLCINKDKEGNMWAGLNSGISQIALASSVKLIKPFAKNASVYSTIVYQNYLYIATSSGLFYSQLQSNNDIDKSMVSFKMVAGTEGQNWNLSVINNKLYLGHHEGAFEILAGQIKQINNRTGFWKYTFDPCKNQILAGNYHGIEKIEGQQSSNLIENFKESSRFLETDEMGNIWISHPYHGVYRIDQNKKIYTYNSKNGLPFDTENYIFKIKNKIITTTKKGIYLFDYQLNKFLPDHNFKDNLNRLSIRYIKEDPEGNLWFIHEKSVGVLDNTSKKPIIYNIPEVQNLLVNGFENIYAFNKNNIFIGSENGLFHINYEKYKNNKPKLLLNFSQIKITSDMDSLLFGGFKNENFINSKEKNPEIPYNLRNIYFDYTTNQNSLSLEYAHQLIGFDSKWSAWSPKNENYYTNLAEGKYEFQVKVRNNFGNETNAIIYHFTVLPPWYRSAYSYLFYSLVVIYGIFLLRKYQKKKFLIQKLRYEKEQESLKQNHEFDMSKTDLDFKNLALSNAALRLLHKAELLSNIKNEIDSLLHKSADTKEFSIELKKMLRTLEGEVKDKLEWQSFSQSFDLVHGDFISKLKNKFPQLTANDLKTCAMIKMNLSSKEIAQILNITLKGVELSRYRLRKKLELESTINLFDFLLKV